MASISNNANPHKPSTVDDNAAAPAVNHRPHHPQNHANKPPSFKASHDALATTPMTTSSTPLGNVNAARRPAHPPGASSSSQSSQLPQDVQAKMKAFHLSRQGAPPAQSLRTISAGPDLSGLTSPSSPAPSANGLPAGATGVSGLSSPSGPLAASPGTFKLPSSSRPPPSNFNSAPAIPNMKMNIHPKKGLAAKRGLNLGMKLSNASGVPTVPQEQSMRSHEDTKSSDQPATTGSDSMFSKYSEYVDTNAGTLKFKGRATVHGEGIDFSSGTSFSISLEEVDTLDELGKGNYGTVYKVRHSRPRLRRPGQGLGANRPPSNLKAGGRLSDEESSSETGIIMAMKEIRLELDEAKFAAIIMELDILHRCVSPFIVDFYGAFFQEGAVYICMEFMDGGSIDKLYGHGIPEAVLRKITLATVRGLKSLKDDHNIIHRDVKPTNILVNTKGSVKICDFGVSGNLVASIAKTNIGCQSYMAPERISGGGIAQAGANPGGGTYSVQSDIWSLGLTIIECALGQYPYPPETYDNIFSQLSVSPAHLSRTHCQGV